MFGSLDRFFEEFAVPERQVAAVQDLTRVVLCDDGRAQRIAGRLLWKTTFLQRAVTALASSDGGGPRVLLEFTAQCITEELERGASRDLVDAVVALAAQHGHSWLPVLLLSRVLECADVDGVEATLLLCIEGSRSLLHHIFVHLTSRTDEAAGFGLALRLVERGSACLCPHLETSASQLSELLSSGKPGSASTTGVLALYSVCSLHPHLLRSLLTGDTAAHLQRLAIGVQANLAASGALQGPAADVADAVVSIVPPEVSGAWFRSCFIAEWLVEACRQNCDTVARTAAARAVRHFASDEGLVRRLRVYASDALLLSCAQAVSATGSGGAELLRVAGASLNKLLSSPCASPVEPEPLVCLLRAACAVPPSSRGTSVCVMDCLFPVQVSLVRRPLGSLSAVVAAEMLEHLLTLARETPGKESFATLCTLLAAVANASDTAKLFSEAAAPEWLTVGSLLLRCAVSLGYSESRAEIHLASALESVLCPTLNAIDGGCVPSGEWWATVQSLGGLVPLCVRIQANSVVAALLAPSLRSERDLLVVSARELVQQCQELKAESTEPPWLAVAAALHTIGHGVGMHCLESVPHSDVQLPVLPLRALVFIASGLAFMAPSVLEQIQAKTSTAVSSTGAEEWRMMRKLGGHHLTDGFRVLLGSEDRSAESVLRGVLFLEGRYFSTLGSCGCWSWMVSVVPSVCWVVRVVTETLRSIPSEAFGPLLEFLWELTSSDSDLVGLLLHEGTLATVADQWKKGADSQACARVWMRFFVGAPDLNRQGVLQLLHCLHSHSSHDLVLLLTALAMLHVDVLHEVAEVWVHDLRAEVGWAMLVAGLARSVEGDVSKDATTHILEMVLGSCSWLDMMQHRSIWVRAFASLGLAIVSLAQLRGNVAEKFKVSQGELPALVVACASNMGGESVELRNGSCLAIVVLLCSSVHPESLRSELLQGVASQQLALTSLLRAVRDVVPSPTLLYLLLLLRSRPCWLDVSVLQTKTGQLVKAVQTPQAFPGRSLLALRVAEALAAMMPPCGRVVLQQVVDTWEVACHGHPTNNFAGEVGEECLGFVHEVVSERICSELGRDSQGAQPGVCVGRT